VVSVTDPYGLIVGFLDAAVIFSINYILNCTYEAEWTPFQTYYFSENLVAQGIEPEPLDMLPGILTARPQRRSIL
jgi:hypothetical protein